jgi:dienelactone hydrolase
MGVTLQWRNDPGDRPERRYGSMVEFGGGAARGTGYMSYSDRVGPGVVVVHDAFGLHEEVISFCDQLNLEGFTVLAPDLYDGRVARSPEEAGALAAELDDVRALRLIAEAATHLTANWHPRVGVVGLGSGAEMAASVAGGARLDALVAWGAEVEAECPSLSLDAASSSAEEIVDFLLYNLS